jgi:predicted kinase
MKTLIMLCGLPKSGKSTWAREQNLPMVNPDSIRLALHGKKYLQEAEPVVWMIAKYMVKSLFLAGHDTVILDATNITSKRRSEWTCNEWRVDPRIMNTPKSVCIERAIANKEYEMIEVIERMYEETDLQALKI